ncbi:sulfatase [Blastopirellula marina]|uniref:Iduronate-2-sulfatase n=1 Tax=Blastopirellula marina TaxID=124 RepID=A0A2S8GB20_9BACT|nr:sulfatase [Blastopirellula marina]PQO41652.1 iduronate-2-sulfatase [Blastopirellula marina]PTL46095.1 iduronate-2-sulfatase [Blastopirellula marina]
MPTVRYGSLICLLLLSVSSLHAEEKNTSRPNVLFIAVDDLNHWVGHLHRNPQTQTPNIDRLASMGVSFTSANCAAPACNPSRAALMSGLRPSTTGVYDNGQAWPPVIPKKLTLTTQFLNAGYNVYGAGKIYHAKQHREGEWTEYFEGQGGKLKLDPSAKNNGVGGIKFGPLSNPDRDMPDYEVVDYALNKLGEQHEKPFFLAVGLVKPHMPWSVPKSYFDKVPLDSIQLPPHTENDLQDVPEAGIKMAKPNGDHALMLKSGRWDEAVQAYLATIQFTDEQVGRLLDGLQKSDYRDNTIIVLWGDHGWHLGEKEHWRKFALWEEACRAPLIWVAPGVTSANTVCDRPVDFMTIYPTLCDLTGIAIPEHVEGTSITPLLKDSQAPWDPPALTTFHRNNHSFRSEKFRYIRYADGSEELYDHAEDPYEWTNLASDAKYDAVKAEFQKHIPEKNVPELPKGTGNKKTKKKAA